MGDIEDKMKATCIRDPIDTAAIDEQVASLALCLSERFCYQ